VVLRDSVAHTSYVAGTLQRTVYPSRMRSLSPLVNGMLVHSPADPTPGSMPADQPGNTANVATIMFDVVVDPNAVNGTVISNQGFVSAPDSGIIDQPSDDPDTPIANDPTLDIVTSPCPSSMSRKSGPATMNPDRGAISPSMSITQVAPTPRTFPSAT
jgi:hypothetical protein